MLKSICVVGAIFALVFATSSAKATTYNYVGNPFDACFIPPSPPSPCSVPGLTASVTFDFNTFGFSGTIDHASGLISAVQIGAIPAPIYQFTLVNAAITEWSIITGLGFGPASFTSGDFDTLFSNSGHFGFGGQLSNTNPGVWTPADLVAPVPGPIAGAGVPGFALACGGLIAWWRRRQQASDLVKFINCTTAH
jgi:hypothetical protein